MNQLLNRIEDAQNLALQIAQLLPGGVYGRSAVVLAYESLRLAWYMGTRDRVGVAEKSVYVRIAYERLAKELDGK